MHPRLELTTKDLGEGSDWDSTECVVKIKYNSQPDSCRPYYFLIGRSWLNEKISHLRILLVLQTLWSLDPN